MSQFYGLLPILEGTTPDANQHRANFSNIQSYYNSHDKNKILVHGLEGVEEISSVEYYTSRVDAHEPVGSVVACWDNEIEAVKNLIDSDYMVELDGSTISDSESMFNGITIPDAKEAYLMSVKSDVIDNTIYNGNSIDLEHTHIFNHYHKFEHIHPSASHSHTKNRGYACLYYSSGKLYSKMISTGNWSSDERGKTASRGDVSSTQYYGYDVDYSVTSVTIDYTKNSSNATSYFNINTYDNKLSTNTDIRPYTIKCRFYLRIK